MAGDLHLPGLRVVRDHNVPSDHVLRWYDIEQQPRGGNVAAGGVHVNEGVEQEDVGAEAELLDEGVDRAAKGQGGGGAGAGLEDEGEGEDVGGDAGEAEAGEEREGVGGGGGGGEGVEMGVPEDGLGGSVGEAEETAGVGEGGARGEGADGCYAGEGKGGGRGRGWEAGLDEAGVELLEVGWGGEVRGCRNGGGMKTRGGDWWFLGALGGGDILV